MSDPIKLNLSSPGAFAQPTQPVENSLVPAQSAPSVAANNPTSAAQPATTTAADSPSGGSTQAAAQSLGDGLNVAVVSTRVPDLQPTPSSGGRSAVFVTAPLTGDGSSGSPLALPDATESASGAMSAADKIKVNSTAAPGFFLGLVYPSLPYVAGDPQVTQVTAAFTTASAVMQGKTRLRLRSVQHLQTQAGATAGELCNTLVISPVVVLFNDTDGVPVGWVSGGDLAVQLVAGKSYRFHFYFNDPTEAHVAHGLATVFEGDLFA